MTDRETTYWLLGLLADKMATVPANNFDIGPYVSLCGTTRCVIGWATKVPELAQRGLRLIEKTKGGATFIFCGKRRGFPAAAFALGITLKEAHYIGAESNYTAWENATVTDAIAHIEKVRAKYAPPLPAVKVTIKLEPRQAVERELVEVTT